MMQMIIPCMMLLTRVEMSAGPSTVNYYFSPITIDVNRVRTADEFHFYDQKNKSKYGSSLHFEYGTVNVTMGPQEFYRAYQNKCSKAAK